MRRFASEQERAASDRMVLDYALYMMVSSYFKKATCTTKRQEGRLYLQYKNAKDDKQVEDEEWCDLFVQMHLMDRIPQEFWDSNVEIALIGHSGTPDTLIRITDGFHNLYLKIRPNTDMDLDGDPVEIHYVAVDKDKDAKQE